jgi:hypothetical protein
MTMEDQTATFLSTLNEMKVEEVRTHFLDLFSQALAIERAEFAQEQVTQKREESEE